MTDLEDRMSLWVAGLQVDAQRLLLASKPGTPEKKLATEILQHIATWKAAKGLDVHFRPDGAPPLPDDQ